jgi:DNA-binding NtrC family response regulator
LLVDDESDIVMILEKFLKLRGFQVDSFTDSKKALEQIKHNPQEYSLVLADIRMPGMNGITLRNEITKVSPKIKIILMTAFEVSQSDLLDLSQSVNNKEYFIKKPVALKDLYDTISRQLDEKRKNIQ